jgi:two-component system sensor histidine kinase PhoQ
LINSLYFRLSLAAILVLVIFLATIGAVLDNAFVASLRLAMRERMLGQLYLLLTVSTLDESGRIIMPLPTDLPEPQLAFPNSGLYAFVGTHADNRLVWQSPSLLHHTPPSLLPLQLGEKQWSEVRWRDGKEHYLLGFAYQRTTRNGVFPFNYYLMADLSPLHKQARLYRQRLWGGLGGTALLLLMTQILLLRWGLRPLRKITGELEAIEEGETDRITGHYPREVARLTDKINDLLTQERTRQIRYRNALADLAHSLKTPLAVLCGAVDHSDTLAATVEEQASRMTHIVERQLQRAIISRDAAVQTAIPIYPLVERIVASLNKVYRDKNVRVSNQVDSALRFRGNEADLMEILGNLLDNSYKWCRGQIHIEGRRKEQSMVIGIHDDGPGINAENTERILQRGVRADESVPGYGIGLAVTSDIVDAYQGEIRIESSFLGGAAVIIEFLP